MSPHPRPNARPAWWRRLRLLDVAFATVPLVCIGVFVFGSACLDYQRIRQYEDWWSAATSVRKFGWYRVRAALALPKATALRERIAAEDPERATVRLRVDRAELDELSSDVGRNWGQWIDAALLRGDREVPAELRFRGDGSAHWTAEKKSLSIKTGKDLLYEGFRRLNFTLKDVLPQYLTNSLAKDFDLLAPETAVVPLFVNEHYYGIFRFVEPVDESFLRRNLRMPGNVYRADAAERGEYFKHQPRDVFLNPTPWERVAENDRPGAPTEWGIHLLLEDLAGSTIEDHARMMARLDRDELSRLLALMLLAGDPYHMSGVHNQLWYDDPVTGKLHPIVWDLRLLDLERPPRLSKWNRFWREALRDPRVMDGALTYLDQQLEDGLLARARARVEQVHERYRDHFEYDRLREGVIHPVGDPVTTSARFGNNAVLLRSWTRDARVAYRVDPAGPGQWLIEVRSDGRAPALLESIELDGLEAVPLNGFELAGDLDFDGRGDFDIEILESGSLPTELRLPAGWSIDGPELRPAPMYYRFVLSARASTTVTLSFKNAITRERIEPGTLAGEPHVDAGAWHPWRLDQLERSSGRVERLAGEIRLDSDLVIESGERLVIEPGTNLALGPDVSILVKGEVRAEGTANAPIAIRNADPTLPFGTFALQGSGADASFLSHVSFAGGGGALLERVEYKGAVNVYGASEVVFEDCSFADNMRCDDLLNVVKGDVDLRRCRFEGANADSIDYDMSTGLITDCDVVGSGNDGLDLMTCKPEVRDTRISGSGDKGISIGEAATPVLEDVTIEGCVVGIELKDLSDPRVYHTRITGCETGLLARRKNWRYAGAGRGRFVACEVSDNGVDVSLLDGASITEYGEWVNDWDRPPLTGAVQSALDFGGLFAHPLREWKPMGGARRILAVDGDLRATFRSFEGAIGRELGWTTHDRAPQALAVTVAAVGARSARLGLTVDGEALEVPLELDPDPSRFRITVLRVPPGKTIQAMAISVDPEAEGARLAVRAVELLSFGAQF